MLTGGSAENFSIILMGLSPYINASIIIQLLTVISPRLEAISKEGEHGYKTLNRYTRWLTLPLALVQSYGMVLLLNSQTSIPIISGINKPEVILPIMLTISTGTIFMMWIGELITERGIGNGISLLIFANIIAEIPGKIGTSLAVSQGDSEKLVPLVSLAIVTIILAISVILVTEAIRKIPITYAGRRTRGEQSMLPVRINQAGMIPIIFAVSVVSFPGVFAQMFLTNAKSPFLQQIGNFFTSQFQFNSLSYIIVYFLFIIAFTYFYVSITFNPEKISEDIQKRGGFIPGIRPGKQTAEFIKNISSRLTLFGGFFLAFIAVAPLLLQKIFKGLAVGSVPLLISGAGMIIVAGVVLELIRQINSQLVMHDYDKLY